MNAPLKRLPTGIQNLAEIVERDCVYIDKTPLLFRLIDQGKACFLSRPRRFGKSLLVDTFQQLFEGNRPLCAGLDIEPHWDWSVIRPVIKSDRLPGATRDRPSIDHLPTH